MDFNSSLTDPEPVSEGLDVPSVPAETSVPETSRCPRCGAEVEQGAGKCLKCGCFQPGNGVAITHGLRRARFTPVETAHRDELIHQLLAERGGRQNVDILTQYHITEYAELTVHIDRIDAYLGELGTLTKAGRQPAALKTRLDISARRDQIAARIRGEASSSAPSGSNSLPGAPGMATSHLDMAKAYTSRQLAGETLTDYELGRLSLLDDAMAGRVSLPPDSGGVPAFDAPVNTRVEGDSLIFLEPGDAGYVEEKTPPAAETCKYCSKSLDACAELREQRPEVWAVLHGSDPSEAARRNAEAAADEADAREFLETGRITAHMREKAEARKPKPTEEERRQAETRRQLGHEGVANETLGLYRRYE